jgi:serine/threonine protein kinase
MRMILYCLRQVNPGQMLRALCGTDGFIAPEMRSQKPYNPKPCDLFSLGESPGRDTSRLSTRQRGCGLKQGHDLEEDVVLHRGQECPMLW